MISVPAIQANKTLYLSLSWGAVLTASMTATFRNTVEGDTRRLTIVTDIRATDISLVRSQLAAKGQLVANWWVRWEIHFFGLKSQCPYEIFVGTDVKTWIILPTVIDPSVESKRFNGCVRTQGHALLFHISTRSGRHLSKLQKKWIILSAD